MARGFPATNVAPPFRTSSGIAPLPSGADEGAALMASTWIETTAPGRDSPDGACSSAA